LDFINYQNYALNYLDFPNSQRFNKI